MMTYWQQLESSGIVNEYYKILRNIENGICVLYVCACHIYYVRIWTGV